MDIYEAKEIEELVQDCIIQDDMKFISIKSLKERLSAEIEEFAQREKDNPDSPDVCKANLAGMSIAYQALLEEIEKRENNQK